MVILVGNVQGTVSSLASPMSLGSFIGASSSHSVVRRVSLSRGNCVRGKKRWHCVSLSVCKYSVTTTDFVPDQGNPVSFDSSNNGDSDKGDGGGASASFGLKPPPRPVLKSSDNDGVLGSGSGLGGSLRNGQGSDNVDERNKVIESLGDVLEKAEKLGNSKLDGEISNGSVNKPPARAEINDEPKDVRPEINDKPKNVRPVSSLRKHKSKTMKSIWRKGDSVANVHKAVKEVQRPSVKSSEVGESVIGGGEKVTSESRDLQPPLRSQPTLQSRPSIAPPPPPPIKKAVILKDDKGQGETPVKPKEKKAPILIDKFASKKPEADPAMARAVVAAPSRPGRGAPPQGRFKDDIRKKGASFGAGPRRRMVLNKDGVPKEGTRDATRKGRKWSKASRRALRLQAAKDAAPVKVEILEVSDQGMLVEELAYNLAITEGEILGSLYSKGVKPDGVQTLDKDMVKMICKDYEVEVIDADPFQVEGLVNRREILEEDDLDKLKDRPPVITIMGHVDHGKVSDITLLYSSFLSELYPYFPPFTDICWCYHLADNSFGLYTEDQGMVKIK